MAITLREMTGEQRATYLEATRKMYAEELVAHGADPQEAAEHAIEAIARIFPDGVPIPGAVVFRAVNDDDVEVGILWIAPRRPGGEGLWWVYDIEVHAAHRGHGYGRLIMEAAEVEARALGATRLGLHVFGDNTVARRLYESLDYVTTDVEMVKPL